MIMKLIKEARRSKERTLPGYLCCATLHDPSSKMPILHAVCSAISVALLILLISE